MKGHVERVHNEEYLDFKNRVEEGERVTFESGFPKRTRKTHAWLDVVIMCLFQFAIVKNETLRKHFAHGSLSVSTLRKYMHRLSRYVEVTVASALPDKFALIFDGWSSHDSQFSVRQCI